MQPKPLCFLILFCGLVALESATAAEDSNAPLFSNVGQLHSNQPDLNDQFQHRNTINPDPIEKIDPSPLDTSLPSEEAKGALQKIVTDPEMISKDYLVAHPDFFQALLGNLLRRGDAEGLKELLAIYKQMPDQDPSVYDWGNAVIALRSGNTEEAVNLYRKLLSHLPENTLIRYQLALALMRDQQFVAAKDQFQKLRSTAISAEDEKSIDRFLELIDSRDSWSFSGGLNFLYNPNINGVPPKGTALVLGNGATVTSSSEQVSASGLGYDFSADKRWSISNNLYASFSGGSFGSYYFGHKNYNDIVTHAGLGIGYRTAITDIELKPGYQYRWYGQGSSGDGSLLKYSSTPSLALNVRQWLSPQTRYNGSLRLSYDKYIDDYDHQSGRTISLNNTILYTRNQNQFFFGGIDYTDKNAKEASSAYSRLGARLGWGQEWPKGISTRATVGYAHRNYDGPDFFNITRKSKEFNAGLSLWHRDIHFWGITPKMNVNFAKTSGNHPFYDTKDVSFSMDFSKTF